MEKKVKTTDNTEAIMSQIQQEIGEDVEFNDLPKEQSKILLQKFGLMPPQLTASEKHLILKETRKNAATVGTF